MGFAFIALIVAVVVVASVLYSAIKVVKEYERGVIFRLGRVQGGPKGPGLFLLWPLVDTMVKIDLRTVTMDVPPQDVITRDNVPARVNAVVYFRVTDPNRSVIEVENHVLATSQISQTTLRSVLGQKDLDELLTNREEINEELQSIIDEQTDPWGVKVSVVEVKDVEIPQQMQRAMARQAESERERRAKNHPAGSHRPAPPVHGVPGWRLHLRPGSQGGEARGGEGGRAPLRGGCRRRYARGVERGGAAAN